MYTIDTTSYDKTKAIPYNPEKQCGYQPRPSGRLAPRTILIHTTNGRKGSSFESEARYIRDSLDISSHFGVSKDYRIVQFLHPKYWIAWHAGCVISTLYSNAGAIGIEVHNTPSEGHIRQESIDTLTWLVKELMRDYNIPNTNIDTHRSKAVFCGTHTLGRKIDPSIWPDNEFYAWRDTLVAASTYTRYKVINTKGVNVRQSPQVNANNIAGVLFYGDEFESDITKIDELGQTHEGVAGTSKLWAHIYKGMSVGKPVDHLGFVSLSNLREL